MFVCGPDGKLVFYNEPAEAVLGCTFAETGEMSVDQVASILRAEDMDGRSMTQEVLPVSVALARHRPAHTSFRISGRTGEDRLVAVTAIPLFAHAEELVGAVAILWDRPEDEPD